jgi:hypothetical protein
MGLWKIFVRLFKKEAPSFPLTPETIELLPEADDASFYRDSKRLLQRFDEFITTAEAECEALSIELDNTLEMENSISQQLKTLNKPGTWHERHLLLKLDRLQLHGDNLKQRIEIYSQNIKVYLNLISKIQDIKAMRMNGLDEDKIETIWVEFKETIEEYRQRVSAEEAGFKNEAIFSMAQEDRLKELRESVMGIEKVEKAKPKEKLEKKPEEKVPEKPVEQRPSLDVLMANSSDSAPAVFESREYDSDREEPELIAE